MRRGTARAPLVVRAGWLAGGRATTSLPGVRSAELERRLPLHKWVRDASLSLTALSWLGERVIASITFEWLSTLGSSSLPPLQPLYGIRGELKMDPQKRSDLYGYRGSQPVRFKNHAYQQHQLDAFGYLAECMHEYLLKREMEAEFWDLLERCVNYVLSDWKARVIASGNCPCRSITSVPKS